MARLGRVRPPARMFELATWLARDLTIKEAAWRMHIAYSTAREYARLLKDLTGSSTLGGMLIKMERWGWFQEVGVDLRIKPSAGAGGGTRGSVSERA